MFEINLGPGLTPRVIKTTWTPSDEEVTDRKLEVRYDAARSQHRSHRPHTPLTQSRVEAARACTRRATWPRSSLVLIDRVRAARRPATDKRSVRAQPPPPRRVAPLPLPATGTRAPAAAPPALTSGCDKCSAKTPARMSRGHTLSSPTTNNLKQRLFLLETQ